MKMPDEAINHKNRNDLSIASLENNAINSGGEVIIDPDQNHFNHLNVHLQFAGQIVQLVQDQKEDPRKAAVAMQAMLPHLLTHLQYMQGDPTRTEQYDSMNEQTSEFMKMADQLNKYAQQVQEQENARAQQQAGQGQQSPNQMVAMNKIQLDQMKFQNDAQIKQAKAQHQMQLQDKKTAQRLMIDRIKASQKYGSIQP